VVTKNVAAIVLAAGLSSRMGKCKALLPWGENRSVIEQILGQLQQTNLQDILVVTGAFAERVAEKVGALGIATIHNPDYATGEMLSSLKVGLLAQPETVAAVLIVLADQPRLQAAVVIQLVEACQGGKGEIVAPRYRGERGHPMLISRRFWDEILALPEGAAPRDVIQRHRDALYFVDVETESVLSDIDTPEDYERERQRAGLVK
jgi:molybdenum cofactor cytidylyltransferase